MAARPSAVTEVVWAFQILAAAQFFLTALDKLADAPPMVQLFATVGFGQWLRYFTGALELVGATLLLMPSFARLGAAVLAIVLVGALTAHLTVLPFSPFKAIALLVMVSIVFWLRRPDPSRASAA